MVLTDAPRVAGGPHLPGVGKCGVVHEVQGEVQELLGFPLLFCFLSTAGGNCQAAIAQFRQQLKFLTHGQLRQLLVRFFSDRDISA